MLELQNSPEHLVAMKITGDITGDDVTKGSKAVEDALKHRERISIFIEIDSSAHYTLEGFVKDIIDGVSKLGSLHHFYRIAMVTDKGWMAAVARIEGLVFSSIDVKVFEPGERDQAFSWASERPEPLPQPPSPLPAIHFIQTTNDKVFAYAVNGRIVEQDIENAVKEINLAFERHDKINVLVRMKDFGGFDLMAVLNGDLFKVKYKALSKVDRYAVVGPRPWMRNFLELIAPAFNVEIRIFETTDEEAAWKFVGASQALLPESPITAAEA
ncbi:MAG: STAS/SEC14 domain-containing protein [Blastocatellia bacterium]|nr:STAS/SEC14 domain-containing protein [Blastocatellia bacterium]